MRTSPIFVTVALALASRSAPSSNSPAGAVYFLSNDPSGNKVVSVPVGSNGILGPTVKGFSTGGHGMPGITTPPNTSDTLFSQGAIWVHSKAKLLAAVNSGSNSVSLFSINAEDPTQLKLIGKPAFSGGEFPESVVINSKATEACVLNGGKVNGINCYTIHPNYGLIPKPGTLRLLKLNQTTPASGPFNSLSQVIFSPDDSRLIVAFKGNVGAPGFLATWTVSSNGDLSSNYVKSIASGGGLPFSLTPIPGHNAYLSADAGSGIDIFNFGGTNGRNGKLEATSKGTKVPGQVAMCWSTYGQKSGNFYTTDTGTNLVTEVHVDKNLNVTLVKQYQLAGTDGILDAEVATVGHNDFLYVLSAVEASIDVLAVNTPGKATIVQSFAFTSAAKKANVKFTNLNLVGLATYIKN